jgi:nucleoside-diphosphate-sugar epimerase
VSRQLETVGAVVFTVGRTPAISPAVRALVADLQDMAATEALFARVKPDYVLHLASHVVGTRSPEVVLSTFHSNLTSTVNLLVAAKSHGCRRVVLTGSLEEPDPSLEWPVPSSPYAAAKFAAGAYGRMFNALFDLPVVILRVFMVCGPGQQDARKLVPYTINALLQGERPSFSSGTREVDWVFVDDVASAFVRAAIATGIEGGTFDVGSGELVTVGSIVEVIHELMLAPSMPEFGGAQDRAMEQIRRADVAVSEHALGWRANVSLHEGLRATIDWYAGRALT